jgi:hypothetical protein
MVENVFLRLNTRRHTAACRSSLQQCPLKQGGEGGLECCAL